MWFVTYLGLLLAPGVAFLTSLLALYLSWKQKRQTWQTTWIILATLLGISAAYSIYATISSQGDPLAAAFIFILFWLMTVILSVGVSVLGIVNGLRWKSRWLLVSGVTVLGLMFVLPVVNWVSNQLVTTRPVSQTEQFSFRLYEPTYIPSGFSLQQKSLNDQFADHGFADVSHDIVRYVTWTYEAHDSDNKITRSRYTLNEFDAQYAQRSPDGCIDDSPYAQPTANPTPRSFPEVVIPCTRKGAMPSGEPIYAERVGSTTITSTEAGGTALVLNNPVGTSGDESDSIRILQSVREVDQKNFRDQLRSDRRK